VMRRLLVICAVFFTLTSWAQERYTCIPFSDRKVFDADEVLSFGISYKWGAVNTEVATARIAVENTKLGKETLFHSDVTARTAPFFDVFFKIREHFEGWFQPKTLRPEKCIRDTHEGTYAAYNRFQYDWDERIIHAYVERTSHGERNLEIPLVDCVCDVPSLVFCLRQMDVSKMDIGKPYGLHFAIDDTIFQISLINMGKETVKVKGMGQVRCNYLRCTVVKGAMFQGDEDVKIWLSDDGNQVPVAFWAPLRVGAMKGTLKAHENLLYPMTSVISK